MIDVPTGAVAFSLALTTRPSGGWLALTIIFSAAAYAAWRRADLVTLPPRPVEIGTARPQAPSDGGVEPPAVVGLLTNGYVVPNTAVTSTVLDLARRGWIRFATTEDGELVIFVRGNGRAGDALLGFEQQVLNLLTARSFDGVTSASTLAATRHRQRTRWWLRFRQAVVAEARERQLTRPRFTAMDLGPVAALTAIGLYTATNAIRTTSAGSDAGERLIREALIERFLWLISLGVLTLIAVRVARSCLPNAEFPTEAGERRAGQWLGYRRRLADVIPSSASVLTTPEQQLALAHATVMGVTPHVMDQLPIAAEDHRAAWSEAGGLPHVVRVRYPFRPGYGRSPVLLSLVGIGVLAIAQWPQRFLHRVADGEALQPLMTTFPDHTDRVTRAVGVLGDLMWIPSIWAVWAIAAGIMDSVLIRERNGAVVRVRRPTDVVPASRLLRRLVDRDHFSVFIAVDDGRRRSVTAWVANERTAVPEGAQARVSATRILGHVRSSAPIGTSTRLEHR